MFIAKQGEAYRGALQLSLIGTFRRAAPPENSGRERGTLDM
jgi:hypothetical protein